MSRSALSIMPLVSLSAATVGCSEAPPPAPPAAASRAFRGSVAFAVGAPSGTTTATCRTTLTVAKPGRTPLVDADPNAGGPGACGWHDFPRGSTGAGAPAYHAGWLTNNGWRQPGDFTVHDHVIVFFGVSELEARSSSPEMVVSRTVDGE